MDVLKIKNVNNNENNNMNSVSTGDVNVTTGDVNVHSESHSETGDQTVNQWQQQGGAPNKHWWNNKDWW